MIGQTIEHRPRPPWDAVLWLLAAIAFDVLAFVSVNPHPAVFSLLPWLVALLLWRARSRPFTARFTETALEVEEPPLQVPYAELQGLLAPRRPANPFKAGPRSYLIQVIHSGGVLLVPAKLNIPSDEVFSFLYRQFSPSGSRDVPPSLLDFLRNKERRFGPDRVWTYRARIHLGLSKDYPRLKVFFLALFLSGIAWFVWGIARGQEGWMGGGPFAFIFGAMFSFLFWLDRRRNLIGVRHWRQAGLVVAPDGLALVQGELVGELVWDEVKDVKIGKSSNSFQFTIPAQALRGILLIVEGANIVIADLYDRPLSLIHEQIRHYWREQTPEVRAAKRILQLDKSKKPQPHASDGITPSE